MTVLKSLIVMFGLIIGVAAAESVSAADTTQSTGQSSVFSNVAMKTSGNWSIENRADGTYIVLADNFKTRKAPDLKIFLSKLPAGDVESDNAADGVFVAELKSAKGGQAYKLPDGVDLGVYQSIVIHCEQYTKFWAAGSLM